MLTSTSVQVVAYTDSGSIICACCCAKRHGVPAPDDPYGCGHRITTQDSLPEDVNAIMRFELGEFESSYEHGTEAVEAVICEDCGEAIN